MRRCSVADSGQTFGWQIHTRDELNDRSLRNFPMQANGAEMLRIACILLTEAGIRVCAPVHDALLIEAPLDELDRGRRHHKIADEGGQPDRAGRL